MTVVCESPFAGNAFSMKVSLLAMSYLDGRVILIVAGHFLTPDQSIQTKYVSISIGVPLDNSTGTKNNETIQDRTPLRIDHLEGRPSQDCCPCQGRYYRLPEPAVSTTAKGLVLERGI